MVCTCCTLVIRQVLEKAGVRVNQVSLGEVNITYNPSEIKTARIEDILARNGFPVVQDKEKILVEQIKTAVIELIHFAGNKNSIIRNSDYLVEKLGLSYQYLSGIFSKHEGTTLERFIILHKIEKVKELIEYGDLTLSEISYDMGYSSVQYLSAQFRAITGESVTSYRKAPGTGRKPINEIY